MVTVRYAVLLFIPFFILLLMLGCSHAADPVAVDTGTPQIEADAVHVSQSNRLTWGVWTISIPEDRSTIEVLPDRTAAMHLNVVRLLEVAPCANCLTIENITFQTGSVTADFKLIHPFPGLLKLTGFDVRGIFISGAGYDFPVSGKNIAYGSAIPRMSNPDGYTRLFNPTEYPETLPAALGYIAGKFANGGDLSATLNPYMAFETDIPRCMFLPGIVSSRNVEIQIPPGPVQFGYAVDACWQLVDTVTDPVVDFPPDANCIEAYRLDVQVGDSLNVSTSGPTEVVVEVFDHQGFDTISTVSIEAPVIFDGAVALEYSGPGTTDSWFYHGEIYNENGLTGGDYPFLVRVTDAWSDQNLGMVDAWHVVTVSVGGGTPADGWARTWGDFDSDRSYDAVVDNAGNIYVCGWFNQDVDFDPGPGEWILSAGYGYDGYVSKFTSAGDHLWTYSWGNDPSVYCFGLTLDAAGYVYISGYFNDIVDFDPGDGVDERTAPSGGSTYLTKFDPDGNHVWVRDWPGYSENRVGGVTSDLYGGIYVSGSFKESGDFDPGPNQDIHNCLGNHDAYVCMYDYDGNFIWARTWGAEHMDMAFGIAVATAYNCVYVTGKYSETVDFDPGPGIDEHTSVGGTDIFLTKFNLSGDFVWARTWGGPYGGDYAPDFGEGVATFGQNVYVTGLYMGTVDFDPGLGVVEFSSIGNSLDCFLSCFDDAGYFGWVCTWGSIGYDGAWDCETDPEGNILVGGWFSLTTDFDPDPSQEDLHISNGATDIFLVKFDPSGGLIWTRTWGGNSSEFSLGIGMDVYGTSYVSGIYSSPTDFDPGPGVDEHPAYGMEDAFLLKVPSDGYW